MPSIRFRFSPAKARAAIHWMVQQAQPVDLHALLKACYFADKAHLNRHRRPIFGARYRAMKFGPVPLEIYEMAKGEALWLAELAADRFPWILEGHRLTLRDNSEVDLQVLSLSDREALASGFASSRAMTFDERTAATHGTDWQAAQLGPMRYEDMIDESEAKPALLSYLAETALHMKL